MLYKEIKITCKDAEDRLYRVLHVRNDMDLLTLGYIILDSLYAEFKSPYVIEVGEVWYVFDSVLEDDDFLRFHDGKELRALSEFHLKDIPDHFKLKYFDNDYEYEEHPEDDDMPWEFDCTVGKKDIKIASDLYAFMIDGKGMGLWEDEREAYFEYLKGNIDPNEEGDVGFFWVPQNLDIETYGETDSAFDLEIAKEDLEADMYPAYIKDQVALASSPVPVPDWVEDEEWDDDNDDDMLDFFDEPNQESLTKGAMGIAMMTVMAHIENLDFVEEKFDELCEKYEPQEAMTMILEIVTEYLEKFIEGDLLKDNSEYRKKIKKLK